MVETERAREKGFLSGGAFYSGFAGPRVRERERERERPGKGGFFGPPFLLLRPRVTISVQVC